MWLFTVAMVGIPNIGHILVLSLFRVLRRYGYSRENNNEFCTVIHNVYHMTVPRLSMSMIRGMLSKPSLIDSVFMYLRKKSFYTIHILYHTHILNQLIESCSIQGLDLTDELMRGLRINKDPIYQFVCLNATESQLALQPATVAIPMVMEPMSSLYTSPIVVMDFQSLYPSVMIAYNICFSTCLGNINKQTGV